jgi:CheY-like chemotaxis protein/putative methionine-R-sulfoxide reductase with GAF domain
MDTTPKILIVDDKPQNLFALEKLLQKLEVEVYKAETGNEALGLTLEHEFALAILDVQMPEMDGYELAELLRGNEATLSLPIIFVSAIYSDEYHHRKGYDSGAVDFLSKPFIPEILLSKVRVFIDLDEKRRNLQNLLDELNRSNNALSRRTLLLETSAKVGQQITSILDFNELLSQVTSIIQMQFHYPWVSVWLVSADQKNLTLEARTKNNVELGSVIPVAHKGLVGQACRTGENIMDNKAGQNTSFAATPGLPVVFSELAIPLKFGRDTLGVLDIQSERLQAFNPEDVAALQLLSVQIAVAVRNARLYSEVLRLSQASKNTAE